MQVMEFALLPTTSGEDVTWRDASVLIWHVIMQKYSMLHRHQPRARVSCIRPMDGGVKHHGSGNGHDGFDISYSNDIVMVGSHARKPNHLCSNLASWEVNSFEVKAEPLSVRNDWTMIPKSLQRSSKSSFAFNVSWVVKWA
jgi:hypothetical protein